MIKKTMPLWIYSLGFILLISLYSLMDSHSPKEKAAKIPVFETNFDSFLKKFKPLKFPATFNADDFSPVGVICCTEGKHLDSSGKDVMTLMLSVPQLEYWVKNSKELHPELREWLNGYGKILEFGWYEIYAGIHISQSDCEIFSIHTYTARSATNGGDTDNWLLYFSKRGKLLKTEKLDRDRYYASRGTVYLDEPDEDGNMVEDHWESTGEVTEHTFHLQSMDSLVTETRKSRSIEFYGSLKDTSYFNETFDDPIFVSRKFSK